MYVTAKMHFLFFNPCLHPGRALAKLLFSCYSSSFVFCRCSSGRGSRMFVSAPLDAFAAVCATIHGFGISAQICVRIYPRHVSPSLAFATNAFPDLSSSLRIEAHAATLPPVDLDRGGVPGLHLIRSDATILLRCPFESRFFFLLHGRRPVSVCFQERHLRLRTFLV